MSSKILTFHQACWAELLSEFHFPITYHPGNLATLPDALSRQENVYPERGEDFISKNPMNYQKIIKQDAIKTSKFFAVKVEAFSNWIQLIQKSLWQDSQCRSILQDLGKDWVVVPNDPKIQLSILQKRHDSPLAGYPGQEKTLKLVNGQILKNGSFHSNNVFNNFNRFGPFIDQEYIFSKNGLPSSIVSERGSLFVSSFWTNLCQQLKISRDLSTAYHPETDGQTERVNQRLEQYLQMYVSYHQYDWNTWLPMAEFAYNNSDHSSTKQSLFFTVYGRDQHFESVHITQDAPAGKLSTKIQSVQQDVKRELEVSINRFKRYADNSRASPPVLNPGEMVWLSSKNIKSTITTKTLPERWLGPFPILKKVSTHAYHLKLPSQWKSIHLVFHISLLEPVNTSKIPNRNQEPPSTIIIEEEEECAVSQILDSKLKRGK
ncbi:hypothetical protein O181_098918 [Austropuccinia psidii MF-1]|uniref:Integrase catalytic domain-containing protein n=1 Tax=Austropuccinia psidii MF-1 TaxID=1389203 RepID=A0A9Q3PEN0_9BASI|nr:hypothetical protein [Austropuccinia psidii MF-1]